MIFKFVLLVLLFFPITSSSQENLNENLEKLNEDLEKLLSSLKGDDGKHYDANLFSTPSHPGEKLAKPIEHKTPLLTPRDLTCQSSLLKTTVFNNNTRIAFLPQIHGDKNWEREKENIAMSQFKNLNTILDYKNNNQDFVVFNEGFLKDIDSSLMDRADSTRLTPTTSLLEKYYVSDILADAKRLFSTVPRCYEQLTEEQKIFLISWGAPLISLLLGVIDKLYATITREEHLSLPRSGRAQVAEKKEQHLELKIREFLKTKPNFNGIVFIIYGARHEFCDNFQFYFYERGEDPPLSLLNRMYLSGRRHGCKELRENQE